MLIAWTNLSDAMLVVNASDDRLHQISATATQFTGATGRMKAIELIDNGRPDQICRCVEVADVGAPARNEAVVEIAASAITRPICLSLRDATPDLIHSPHASA